ncbi:hypothetical protein V5O48_013945 [Marasmius crinis-equi]|uniref:Uncharacterized protein n=1 Tax=Marasmius crinis-equi TaxID=585013 RepID=A0ABR3EYN8_9AGAR
MASFDRYKDSTQNSVLFHPVTAHVEQHFVADGKLFSLIQPDLPAPGVVPSSNALHFNTHCDTLHFREFNWIHPDHPFMALVPRLNVFEGSLFSCLDYKYGRFPMFRDNKGHWRLALKTASAWDGVELCLKNLVCALLEVGEPGSAILSKHFSLWSYPAHYGYKLRFKSREELQKAAATSRDAFLPLLAAGALGLRWMERREQLQPGFLWQQRVAEKTSLHPEFLSAFERSYAASTGALRVGGIPDCSDLQRRVSAQVLVALFKSLNAQICIYWGECTTSSVTSTQSVLSQDKHTRPHECVALAYLLPTLEQVWLLKERS